MDGGKTGTFTLEGTAGLVRDNRVDLDGTTADEHGKLSGIDGAVISRSLTRRRRSTTVRGTADATFNLALGGGKATVGSTLTVVDPVVGGTAFAAGEQFKAAKVELKIPPRTSIDMSARAGGR